MSSFNTLITKIFKTHGYDILRNSEHMQYILANKDNITLAVGYLPSEAKTSKREIRSFIKSSRNDDAHRSIFISMEEIDDDIKHILEGQNVELWERERFERELGRAMISDMPVFESEKKTEPTPVLDIPESSTKNNSERHEIMVPFVLGEVQTTISGERKESIETGLNIMIPKISQEEAKTLTKKVVRSFRFDLQLIPYYIFDYTCEIVEGPRKKPSMAKGTLGINTLSNHIEEWPESFETASSLDQEFTKLEPAFSLDEALTLIKQAVIELNTRELETIEDKGTAIIIEKKRITPKEDVMEISSRGTVYMPVWCVEGSNGLITIDATSGKVIKEDIYKDKNVSFL